MTLRAGGATDVGRVRAANEDRYLVGDGLFAVADGVGGHQAGDVASQTAVDTLASSFDSRTLDALVAAVEAANRAVWELAQEAPEKRGMGTTMAAVALVEVDGEEQLGIANVGDSRAYVFQEGELYQISDDHSLVAELVREGRLTPADAQVHPQRSIITRALGMEPEIEVDSWTLLPSAGDRLLLCSDGLTNEIPDEKIAATLRRLSEPQDAAEDLVRQARAHGGNDNITVVVVEVDTASGGVGGGEGTTLALATGDGGTGGRAEPAGGDGWGRQQGRPSTAVAAGATGAGTATWGGTREAVDHRWGASAGERPVLGAPPEPERPRRLTWRVATFFAVFLVVLGAGSASIAWYARSAYFVGALDDGDVAIFKGRPGGVLWFGPTLERRTDLTLDDLPTARRSAVEEGKQVTSIGAAERYLANVRAEAEALSAATSIPPVTTVPATTTTTSPGGTTTTGPTSNASVTPTTTAGARP